MAHDSGRSKMCCQRLPQGFCPRPAVYSTGSDDNGLHWCEEHLPDWARRRLEQQDRGCQEGRREQTRR